MNGPHATEWLEGTIEDRQMLFFKVRCAFDGLVLVDVLDDVVDLGFAVLQTSQGFRDCLVDNLQQPAADELLILDQGNIRFHAGGVAIHHESDGPRRGQYCYLRVLVAIALTLNQRVVPGSLSSVVEVRGEIVGVQLSCSHSMFANDSQHGIPVEWELGKGSHISSDQG